MSEPTKKCRYCAEEIRLEAILCKHCGMSLTTPAEPITPPQPLGQNLPPVYQQPVSVTQTRKSGNGLGIASLILGGLAVFYGLADIGMVVNGDFAYIDSSEIGILAIMSLTALGLGIASKAKGQKTGVSALVVSIIAVVVMVSAAGYSL